MEAPWRLKEGTDRKSWKEEKKKVIKDGRKKEKERREKGTSRKTRKEGRERKE